MYRTIIGVVLIVVLNAAPLAAELRELRVGWTAVPQSLDPAVQFTTQEFSISLQIFEGLTSLQAGTLTPQPGVAERWDLSEDGLTYTFYLRPNAVWSDGTPITAETFVTSWLRALNPATNSLYAFLLFSLVNARDYYEGRVLAEQIGMQILSPLTLQVTLTRPTPYFLQLTALPIYLPVPEHALRQHGEAWTVPDHFVGNGPFVIAEPSSEGVFVIEKNPMYWDRERVMLDRVVYCILKDCADAVERYKTGDVEWVPGIASTELATMLDHPDLLRFPILGTLYYALNTTHPALNDVRVRKALYLALHRGHICRTILKSGDLPAFGFVPPRIAGYANIQGNRENPELARQLLAEAGYPNGQGFPELAVLGSDYTENRLIAGVIQTMWQEELNIRVRLDLGDIQTYWQKVSARDFDMLTMLWVGDYVDPSTFLEMFESASHKNNLTGWEDEAYRALIQHAQTELDAEQRLQYYARAERLLIDQAPIIPLFHAVAVHLLNPSVSGIYPNLMDLHPLKNVTVTPGSSHDS